VDTVIVDGEVCLRRGRAQRIDEEMVWREAAASARRMVEVLKLKSGPSWPVVGDQDP
jgi:hypothetical protein